MGTCTRERFLKDVHGHQMTVLHAADNIRHIRFKKPGDSSYWFDLITWPGALCIDGDMGTYVFKRTEDMFEFFRRKDGGINEGYWAEKVVAQCKNDGIEEFDQAAFIRHVVEHYRDYWRGRDEWAAQLEGFRELREQVLEADGEHAMFAALSEFEHQDFRFQDFWEWSPKRYTSRFIWNLYAIAWGIKQFDTATT